jgi:A/G-specific adenine glycosylase
VPTTAWGDAPAEPAFPLAAAWRHHGTVVHVFTHFRLELDVWSATATDLASLADGWWAPPAELDGEALPTLFRKVLAAALESEAGQRKDGFPRARE